MRLTNISHRWPIALIICLVLGACSLAQDPQTTPSTDEQAPSTAPATAPTADTSTDQTAEDAQDAPIAAVAPEVNECINCHTNKQMLIDTAGPPKDAHGSESTGEG